MEEDKIEEIKPVIKIKPINVKSVVLTPEQLSSRQLAHANKVARYLAGGK